MGQRKQMSDQNDILKQVTSIVSPDFNPRIPLSNEAYVNNPSCPVCKANEYECREWFDNVEEIGIIVFRCNNCKTDWQEEWKCTGYRIINKQIPHIVDELPLDKNILKEVNDTIANMIKATYIDIDKL